MKALRITVFALVMSASPAVVAQTATAVDPETPPPAAKEIDAPSAPEVSFNARLRPRLVLRDNHAFGLAEDERVYNRGDNLDLGTLQARLGADLKHETLSGAVMLQYAGRNGLSGGNQLTDPTVGMHVAYAKWQATGALALQLGRFEMSYGAQRLIGSVGYHQVGRAFDGARVFIQPTKKLSIDLFGTKYNDELQPEGAIYDGDSFFMGAYGSYKDTWGETKAVVELFALYDLQRRADGDGTQRALAALGGRGKGTFPRVDVEVEGAFQPGTMCVQDMDGCTDTDMDVSAWFVDSEFGVRVTTLNKLRGFVGFGIASGDDPDTTGTFEGFNNLYPTLHKWLGRMDIIGPRTNIQEIRAGVNWQAWIANGTFAYHDFARVQPSSERVGGEIDLTVWVDVVPGLKCEAVFGVFLPDQGVSNSDTEPTGVAQWTSLTAVATF